MGSGFRVSPEAEEGLRGLRVGVPGIYGFSSARGPQGFGFRVDRAWRTRTQIRSLFFFFWGGGGLGFLKAPLIPEGLPFSVSGLCFQVLTLKPKP